MIEYLNSMELTPFLNIFFRDYQEREGILREAVKQIIETKDIKGALEDAWSKYLNEFKKYNPEDFIPDRFMMSSYLKEGISKISEESNKKMIQDIALTAMGYDTSRFAMEYFTLREINRAMKQFEEFEEKIGVSVLESLKEHEFNENLLGMIGRGAIAIHERLECPEKKQELESEECADSIRELVRELYRTNPPMKTK